MNKRILVPEILDSLPHTDAAAVASRRDLRWINAIMGNHRWLYTQLLQANPQGDILELGAGDGSFGRLVCRKAPSLEGRFHALDLAPQPPVWPRSAHWHSFNLWSEEAATIVGGASVIVANLFLHHFTAEELRRIGKLLGNCSLILACEPTRHVLHLWQGRLLFPILNPITRHDMTASIRAGFKQDEIAESLRLERARWQWQSTETFLGAMHFSAMRISGNGSTA